MRRLNDETVLMAVVAVVGIIAIATVQIIASSSNEKFIKTKNECENKGGLIIMADGPICVKKDVLVDVIH